MANCQRSNRGYKYLSNLLVVTLLCILLPPLQEPVAAQSYDWAAPERSYRVELTVDRPGTQENLTDFPVLIRLSPSKLSNGVYPNGREDLRFFDSDGQIELPYEVESWNQGGDSTVWVKVPRLVKDGSSSIWMYFGGNEPVNIDPRAVWSDGFLAVHHMVYGDGGVLTDSTGNGYNGTAVGAVMPEEQGAAGPAVAFQGGHVPLGYVGDGEAELTVSGFVYFAPNALPANGQVGLIMRDVTGGDLPEKGELYWLRIYNGTTFVYNLVTETDLQNFEANGNKYQADRTAGTVKTGEWMHIALTYSSTQAGNNVKLYVNGYLAGSRAGSGNLANGIGKEAQLVLGAYSNGQSPMRGNIDEVTIANKARSAEWIQASYRNVKGEFVLFGNMETKGSHKELTGLTIAPALDGLVLHESRQLALTGHFSDGTTMDLTRQAAWTTDNPAVLDVARGEITGMAEGTATVAAAVGSFMSSFPVHVSKSTDSLRVMSLNMRFDTPEDTGKQAWVNRLPAMAAMIRQEKPDVIGTQEGLYHQLTDLQEQLPEYRWIGFGREGSNFGEHTAIFYNVNKLKPLEQYHFWLSDTPDIIYSASWGNQIGRMASWVKFQDVQTGKIFYMLNTHLDHQSQQARDKSAELIVRKLQAFDPDVPVFVTADFNSGPDSSVYRYFTGTGQLKDSMLEAGKKINEGLGSFHNYVDMTGGGPATRIDWVLFRGEVQALRGEILTYNMDGQYPSDHYPYVADVLLNSMKTSSPPVDPQEKPPAYSSLWITELVPNAGPNGEFNYMEIYNAGNESLDLMTLPDNGYRMVYYGDPEHLFDPGYVFSRGVRETTAGTSKTIIAPKETKVLWMRNAPGPLGKADLDAFRGHFGVTENDLPDDRILGVFPRAQSDPIDALSADGRAVGIRSAPAFNHVIGAKYNEGVVEAGEDEAIVYSMPGPNESLMRKLAVHQAPTPGKLDPRSVPEEQVTVKTNEAGSLKLQKGGEGQYYGAVLTGRPNSTVTINILGGEEALEIVPRQLVFTPDNWHMEQQIQIRALNDHRAEEARDIHISHSVTSEDLLYDGAAADSVTVTIAPYFGDDIPSAAPGKPVLSDDNGHDTGILDGKYNVTMNMWWGNNGSLYKLYENDVLIDVQQLDAQTPKAQTAITSIDNKKDGVYIYYAELINQLGTTRSDILTVKVTQAKPAKPVLSKVDTGGTGNYNVVMNMWWGTNGTAYSLYENNKLIETKELSNHTPQAQSIQTAFRGKASGKYEYTVELINEAGATSSEKLVIIVK
ncbi:DUF2341 domain-containing protein [Paenibacillus sp. GCM10027626]|uniref:DUF2341 domain-containing protein n=1 Tax=Paenibacillus sp. GCM10027626 TaxID=3273411 RepID=UPI0036362787